MRRDGWRVQDVDGFSEDTRGTKEGKKRRSRKRAIKTGGRYGGGGGCKGAEEEAER